VWYGATAVEATDGRDMSAIDTTPELKTDDEALAVLMDGDIDKVMAGLDKIVEAAPSYRKLFMRWERQHWSTEDFDFSEDARQWADPDLFTTEERRFIRFGFSEFFLGEERVTVELLPFALAAPTHEAQIFLTTQISDEASTSSSGTASIARCSVPMPPGSGR